MVRIVRREQFSEQTFLWEVDAPDVAQAAQPGHFVMLRLDDEGERIPLTVADFDRERGTITIVVQALGKTTRQMRDDFAQGDEFADFAGPLGLPQHIDKVGHVVLVGGGLGVAPVFPQLRAFKQAGNRVTCIIGFRNSDLVFWADKLRAIQRRADRLHRRRQRRPAGLCRRRLARRAGERTAPTGGRDRPDADDARLRRRLAAVRRAHHGVAEHRSWSTAPACAARAASRSAAR